MLLASSSSSEEKNVEIETGGEASCQVEKTQTEVIEDDSHEMLYQNPTLESEQATDVEGEEVTEATKSESETIAQEQSKEEGGEVVPVQVPILR